jgi:hypothetical protein
MQRMSMTFAERFLEAWHNQKVTISVSALAKQVDPQVRIAPWPESSRIKYHFEDGSVIETSGRGRCHKIGAVA